jgi:hypothetical protein
MLAVVLLGIAMGLGIPAVQILQDSGDHLHTRLVVSPNGRERFVSLFFVREPFSSRYLRYLCGRSWRKQPVCEPGNDPSWEVCELAHPEIIERRIDGRVIGVDLSQSQRAEFESLRKIDPSARAYGMNRRPIP